MQFLSPTYLWSALAVGIPILIHLWHQKRGRVLDWAATQWLLEKHQQQSRGLQLDNIWLLLVRCLLLIVLALLLSQPILRYLGEKPAVEAIHLIEPNPAVVSSYRFELEEAGKRGDKRYWVNTQPEPVDELATPPQKSNFNPLTLQAALHQLGKATTEIHLYLSNRQSLTDWPVLRVPGQFRLHAAVDSARPVAQPYLALAGNRKLYVQPMGRLGNEMVTNSAVRLASVPNHTGPIRVWVDYSNPSERQTVQAALDALADVYGLTFSVDTRPVADRVYDWVLTSRPVLKPQPNTLYIVSAGGQSTVARNVYRVEGPLTPQASELVASGQLPERLGELLVRHYGLQPAQMPLSGQQLKGLFVPEARPDDPRQAAIQSWLLVLLIALAGLERWIALRRNA